MVETSPQPRGKNDLSSFRITKGKVIFLVAITAVALIGFGMYKLATKGKCKTNIDCSSGKLCKAGKCQSII